MKTVITRQPRRYLAAMAGANPLRVLYRDNTLLLPSHSAATNSLLCAAEQPSPVLQSVSRKRPETCCRAGWAADADRWLITTVVVDCEREVNAVSSAGRADRHSG